MNNNKARFVWIPLLLAVAIVGGILIGRFFSTQNPFGRSARYDKIESLLQCIEQEYVDTVNQEELIENVMPKILGELDPHSAYIPAKDLESVNEELEGSFSGIGIQFNILNDTINVVSVIPGGPSEKVGILAGDRIISVNDSAFVGKGISNESVMKNLKGPKGTVVKLEILRKTAKKPLTYEVTRGDIPVNSIDAAFMLDDGAGYIKVSKFGRTTYDEFINALSKLNNQGAKSFIIDLRGNSGGLMDIPINMANELLPANRLIVYAEGKAFEREDAISNGTGTFQEAPLIVLTDEWSASSSEIFAGAIQDNDRGLIVGRRTFGKGLVQQQIPFRDGSAVRLTVARYYTPSGRCIQKEYELGKADDYSMDIVNRYKHGEFFNADSIKQNKDLVYHTVNGREVYGGGGIMPDIFVPRDTTGYTSYFNNVVNEGVIYQYAFAYTDKNRDKLAQAKTLDKLLPMLDANTLLTDFVQYAAQKGIRPRPVYINISRKLIVNTLQAYIARNMLGEEAFYKLLLRDDETLRKAKEVLADENTYNRLLSGSSNEN
ncbi:MAG TPA: S41 family peptidase [Candidatus Barnesiella merdipullorum]|nr:S41 family peptidase [Candidatus Barnesiella merdipullorum]